MSKQIYIDENGNEIQVSGTVNSADMLPVSAGSSIMTKQAIDAKQDIITSEYTQVNIGSYGDNIRLCKAGKVVLMNIYPFSAVPAGGWTQLGTLPSGYEPIIQAISDMYSRDDRHLRIRLDTDGKIYVYNYSSAITSTNNAYWTFTYITA